MIGVQFLGSIGHTADRRWRDAISGGVIAATFLLASIFATAPGSAQDYGMQSVVADALSSTVAPGEQMLVESDQLIYDYDNNSVAAVGNVKIYYGGYTLEAEKVTYLKASGRLIATGRVKLTDPNGAAYYSEQFDITDNFADGFVDSLRVETVDRTYFAAERAEREGGEKTTFTRGVYTACEPCADRPEKPPLWQVQAAKIIVNHKEKMIYFKDARMEFLGVPVAWLPFFSTADPSVKRKSGFLTPTFALSETLGVTAKVPYFWALAPNYDVTFTPTAMTRQGLLAEFEWRHRMQNGQYALKMAGIHQEDPKAFLSGASGTYAQRDWRGGLRTTGEFDINQQWSYGWDITAQSDRTFTRHYGVLNDDSSFATSSVHLTGIGERNWFDTRAYYFQVLTDDPSNKKYDQGKQPVVGVTDHDYVFDDPVLGGELTVTSNLTTLYREDEDPFSMTTDTSPYAPVTIGGVQYYHGASGAYTRASTEIEWQRQIVGPMGQLITPFAYVRADAFALDLNSPSSLVPGPGTEYGLTGDDFAFRAVPAVGFDWSLPVMATTPNSTHVFEPMVQVIARPDASYTGSLPNEDSQSLVFDDATLFDRDKYSGFDLAESGVRANAGIRYRGTFSNGGSIEGLIGQSFHLAGENPFATPDAAHAGLASGLETDRSDYVGRVSLDSGVGPRLDFRGRFDEKDFEIQRGEIEATNAIGPLTASASYLYLREYPNDPDAETPISVVRGGASLNFHENWRMFGTVAYDVKNHVIASDSVGLAFDNECVTFSVAYSETREDYSDIVASRQINVLLQLRTLGEAQYRTDITGLVSSD
jgi:LPS-assembly protein